MNLITSFFKGYWLTWGTKYRTALLFLIAVLSSCGPKKQVTKTLSTEEKLEALEQKAVLYRQLITQEQGPSGFIESQACDSLLFSSLAATAGVNVNVQAAEVSSGRWLRRPSSMPECFSNGLSRSTISRDQLLGVLWWAYRTRNIPVIERLWNYGKARDWFMGDDNASGTHTLMTPLVPLLSRLRNNLNGKSLDTGWSSLPLAAETDQWKTGFEAHLQVLQLLLDKQFRGGYTLPALAVIENHAERQPNNPLFQYASGNVAGAVDLLLEESIWPADRLPESQDRFSPWVLERDDGPDWQPGGEPKKHSGADLLFMVYLIRAGI
jgi:hypothetical protein